MIKTTEYSNFFMPLRFLSWLSAGTFLLLFMTRSYKAETLVKVDIGDNGKMQVLSDSLASVSYETFVYSYPIPEENEIVDRAVCDLQILPPQGTSEFRTKHGFIITIPTPSLELSQIIKNIKISFTGKINEVEKSTYVETLQTLLPAVGNHQLLAKALFHPKFSFVIDSETLGIDDEAMGLMWSHMLMALSIQLFEEESYLLAMLRNEFATLNTYIANDCVQGTYQSTNRADPFLFSQNSIAIKAKIDREYFSFMSDLRIFASMNSDRKKELTIYQQLESHLVKYIPTPVSMISTKPCHEIKQNDKNFAVYKMTSGVRKGQLTFYFQGREQNENCAGSAYGYQTDPRTTQGKLLHLYSILGHQKKSAIQGKTITGSTSTYSQDSEEIKYAEWLSFLEQELQPSFLLFAIPTYCEYMTNFTLSTQDEQNYCRL